MQGLLRAWYALPIYLYETYYKKLNVKQEPEPESQLITDPFTSKVEVNLEPSFIVKPDVLHEIESEIAAELVPLQEETPSRPTTVEEPLVKISVDLPAELTMELLLFSSVM